MARELDGKVAIISGGANGIGRAIARRFVAEGAAVVIADLDEDAGAREAHALGQQAVFQRTDVAHAVEVEALVNTAVERFGGLHIMCNNAGVSGSLRRFLDDDLRDFDRVMAVDVLGVMLGSRHAALHMVDNGGGAILNVASGAGITPGIGMLPYRVAKAGVAHFTRSIAVELGEHGVRANCIAPANIATTINASFDKRRVTRLQPLPHQGRPDDIVEAALYLVSDRSAHVTGVVLPVDGGMAVGTPPPTSGIARTNNSSHLGQTDT